MEEKKSLGKELQEKLTFTQPHIADEQPDAVAEAERFCVDYKAFLDAAKTEREAAAEVERRALAAGYRPMQRKMCIRDRYCSFSMEMIVRLETCVRSASCCCVSPAAVRSSFSFVFMRSSEYEVYFS